MTSQARANLLIAALASAGVERFFIAPGSRSQALAIAASKLEQSGKAKITVRLDERSLGFTALGAAQASSKPVAIIVTSGTAVANLLPAVLEAFHSSTPLVLLTADRPARLRGRGANQTLDAQSGIFGYASNSVNLDTEASDEEILAAAKVVARSKHPTQLNIEFDLPLSDGKLPLPTVSISSAESAPSRSTLEVEVDNHTVVISGSGGSAAAEFAAKANLPLIAEPSSGARRGTQAIQFPIAALRQNRNQIRRCIVFGKPTLSRVVQELIANTELFTCSDHGYGSFDPFGNLIDSAQQLIPIGQAADDWLESFNVEFELSERQRFVSAVWQRSETLVLGASDLIRELDQVAEPRENRVFANRGLSGIDGTVSTAIGIALERGETTLLVGDLTLLHEAGGLNLTDLGDPPLRIVVGNDFGGHIFSRLEVADEIDAGQLSRLFLTPQQVDLAALAAAYGWEYRVCNSLAQLDEAWPISAPTLIDYRL